MDIPQEVSELAANLNKLVGKCDKTWLSGLAAHIAKEHELEKDDVMNTVLSYKGTIISRKPTIKDQVPVEFRVNISNSDRVVLVLNYGEKCHALFGDFKDKYKKFRTSVLSPEKWAGYNQNLAMGPGWFVDKKSRDELEEALETYSIEFETVDFKDIKSGKARFDKDPKCVEKVSKVENGKIKKNRYGNYHHAETDVVFAKLPVGKSGKDVLIAIGTQNTTQTHKTVKGLESVDCLTDGGEKICKKKKWRILTEPMIDTVENVDDELAASLRKILLEYDNDEVTDSDSSLGSGVSD